MNKRKFLRCLAGITAIMAYPSVLIAAKSLWIQKRQHVMIQGLGANESHITVVPFSAGPGEYAMVTSNADRYGLIANTSIDESGNVVITTYNPGYEPVSASVRFVIRLYKM